ncbi:hypothetical protein PABG_11816 [Paracoccidioides brasiliensis Pb03]|nr:hypothetical protein PABG_11816 [Paracoccidioides brasiliensis Pb03]
MSVKEGEVQGMAFDDSGRANLTSIQGQFNKLIVKAYLYVTGNPKGGNERVEFVPQICRNNKMLSDHSVT